MNESELGYILRGMYEDAPEGYKVASIHHFGVKYAAIITRNNYSIATLIRISGINASYATEVSKGVKLAKYVVTKE